MKTKLSFLCILLLLAGRALAADGVSQEGFRLQDLLPRSFQPDPYIHFSVITEMSRAGRQAVPATPENPVYYLASNGGLVVEGPSEAGQGLPAESKLASAMAKALQINGYLPADATHPPSLFIFYRWGYFGEELNIAGFDSFSNSFENTTYSLTPIFQIYNYPERLAVVGGVKFAKKIMQAGLYQDPYFVVGADTETSRIVNLASTDLYFVIASAYDITAAEHGERKLMWQTNVSTDSTGITLAQTVPALLVGAGAYLGREMTQPYFLMAHLSIGHVQVGKAVVEGYSSP